MGEVTPQRLENVLSTTRGVTFTQHLLMNSAKVPHATGEFNIVMSELLVCAKIIASKMQRAGIADVIGTTDETNVQGESVKLMDIVSNDVIKHRLLDCGHVCMVVTEEETEPLLPSNGNFSGHYIFALDPLDGSSNIDCNVPVGTIFGLYRRTSPAGTQPTEADVLQPAKNMVAAGYITYGTSVMLVVSYGAGVHGFTFDPLIGEFILSHPRMTIPKQRSIYSVNEGNYFSWPRTVQRLADYLKQVDGATKRPYSARYVGSMVADVHRTLLYGGLFMYPSATNAPNGKLRYLYEVGPMSFLCEQAGGMAIIAPNVRVMDHQPTKIHERVPVFLGSSTEVELAAKFLSDADDDSPSVAPSA